MDHHRQRPNRKGLRQPDAGAGNHRARGDDQRELRPGHDDPNKPPSITIASECRPATAGAPVTLTASVTDDGLPKPRVMPRPSRPPAARPVRRADQFILAEAAESAERQLASVSRAGEGDLLAYRDDSCVERPGGDHRAVRSPGHLHAGGDGDRSRADSRRGRKSP